MCKCKDIQKECVECQVPCMLIPEKCLLENAGLKGVKIANTPRALKKTIKEIRACFPTCFDLMCEFIMKNEEEKPLPEWMLCVVDGMDFLCAIGSVYRYYWFKYNGLGEPTDCGWVIVKGTKFQDDETIGFEAHKYLCSIAYADMKRDLKDFKEWLDEKCLECMQKPKPKCACACDPCECHVKTTNRCHDNFDHCPL